MPRKTYKKSENCELAFTPLSWNILDTEQLKDLEFIEDSPNKSGKIKECIRLVRMYRERTNDISLILPIESYENNISTIEEIDKQSALSQLVD